jgi:hypothetical protein
VPVSICLAPPHQPVLPAFGKMYLPKKRKKSPKSEQVRILSIQLIERKHNWILDDFENLFSKTCFYLLTQKDSTEYKK